MDVFEQNIVLENARVILRPMVMEDVDNFRPIALKPDIWQFTIAHIFDEQELHDYVANALKDREKKLRYPFTIIDKQTSLVGGSTSYLNVSEYHRKLEIGATWLSSTLHRTGLNRACKLALLTYAFEQMDMERVEFKTGSLNLRSQKAIKGIGATWEGVLRNDTQLDKGRRRDTVYFSILRSEWPDVKARLSGGPGAEGRGQ